MKKILPHAPIDKLMRVKGTERVSEEAVEELSALLEDIGLEISKRALALSLHAGRTTVKPEDVKMAIKDIWG